MRKPPVYLTMKELAEIPLQAGRYTRIIPGRHLKYAAPGVDGLGLSSFSLLLPESVTLFVSPAGCARHVKMRAFDIGKQDRVFLLRVTEEELVTGTHLARIPEAVEEILQRVEPTPKAIYISSSCIDTILASDYDRVCRELSVRFPQVRFKPSYMDPIMFDSKKSPDSRIHCSLFAFIGKQQEKDRGINVLGPAALLGEDADLTRLLAAAGVGPVRQIARYRSLAEADEMGRSALNLAVGGPVKMAAEQFEAAHGTPYLLLPPTHDPDRIHAFYQKLGEQLGVEIDDSAELAQAKALLRRASERCRGKKIVVGKNYYGNPFETAKTLMEYGFTVAGVVKNKITPKDKPVIQWLAERAPEMVVYSGDHPTLNVLRLQHEPADLVIGTDVQHFYPEARAVVEDKKQLRICYQAVAHLVSGLCGEEEAQ